MRKDADKNMGEGVSQLVSAGALPYLAHRILAAKHATLEARWKRNMERLAEYRSAHAGRFPTDAHADGEDGALAIWFLSAERQCREGTLAREKAEELAGLAPARFANRCKEPIIDEEADRRAYLGVPGLGWRVASDVICAATCAICAWASASAVCALLALAIAAISCVLAMCDAQARILPFELSYCLYPLAILYTLSAKGAQALPAALGCALVILAFLLLSRRAYALLRRPSPCGLGDVRTLPALGLCGAWPGTVYGLAALCATLIACAAITFLKDRDGWAGLSTRLPMGTGICIGICCALIACAMAPL